MIFEFVVRRLHFLTRIPGAAHWFDAFLVAWTAIRSPGTMRAMEEFQGELERISNLEICRHAYGGVGFVVGGAEFAHMHGNGLVDVRLTMGKAEELVEAGAASPHHLFGRSAWVSLWIKSRGDIPKAMGVLKTALE